MSTVADPQEVIKQELWARLDEVMRPVGSRHELDVSASTLGDWLGDRVFAALFEAGLFVERATVAAEIEQKILAAPRPDVVFDTYGIVIAARVCREYAARFTEGGDTDGR